jgi:GT2 family glycosyltransferase
VGIREAKGRIIALIDDDCIAEPEWLNRIISGYEKDEKLAGIGGQTFPVDTRSIFSRYQDIFSLHRPHEDNTGITFLVTNNASFRKDRVLEIGGFDETYFMAAEDVDLSRRLLAKGYTLGYQPGAKVRHQNIESLHGYMRMCYRYGQGQALLHKKKPAWYKMLRTVWWSRQLLSWVWIPFRARRLNKEKSLSWTDSFIFAALASGQDMIGFIGSLSQMRHIIRGES